MGIDASFYEKCLDSGYTNIADPEQHKQIELLAMEMNIDYSNIDDYYNQAKKEYLKKQKEIREKERIANEEQKRKSVNGNLLCTVKTRTRTVYVYKRPDLSIYCELPSSGREGSRYYKEERRVEGVGFAVRTHTDTAFTMVPSQTIFTGAVVGGVATGGFHQTKAGYDFKYAKTDKGFVTVKFGDEQTEDVCSIQLCDYAAFLYSDKYTNGFIKCMNADAGKGFNSMAKDMARANRDVYEVATMVSAQHKMEAYPMSTCAEICDFIRWYTQSIYPYSKNEPDKIYKNANKLSQSEDPNNVRIASKMFLYIKDYEDAADKAISVQKQSKDLVEQKNKERLERIAAEKEAIRRRNEKIGRIIKISIPIVIVVIIAVAILFETVISPMVKRNKAEKMIRQGQYLEALSLLDDLGEDSSSELVQRCNYQLGRQAMNQGNYRTSINYFEEAGNYNDAEQLLDDSRDYLELINIRDTLDESVAEAYPMLCDLDSDLPEAMALMELCETYIPYCGDYSWCIDGSTYYFTSDFAISNRGNVSWLYDGNCPSLSGCGPFYDDSMSVDDDMSITNTLHSATEFVVHVYFKNGRISTRYSGYMTYDQRGYEVFNLQDFYDSGEIYASPA